MTNDGRELSPTPPRRYHRSVAAHDSRPETRVLSADDFAAPIDDRYFEDYHVGAVYEYGTITVGEAEILDFARRYDPQPFHVDRDFALTGPFRGLIASGFHTSALFMRLFADHYLSRVASLGSPGIDELRWTVPVRPGDALRLRTTITDARVSHSKPDRGLVHTYAEILTGNDVVVMHLRLVNLLARRPASERSPHVQITTPLA